MGVDCLQAMKRYAAALAVIALAAASAPALAQDGGTLKIRGTTTFEDELEVPMPGDDAADAAEETPVPKAAPTRNATTTSDVDTVTTGSVKPVQPGPWDENGAPVAAGGTSLEATSPRDNFDDDADAYEQLGLRAGSFLVLPAVEIAGGGSDNIDRINKGKSGGYYRVSPEVVLRSDWSRHQLEMTLKGSYTGYPDSATRDDPSFEANANGRIDVREGTSISLEGGYSLEREDMSSAEVAAGTETTAEVHQLRGAVGLTQEFGRFALTGKGSLDRTLYTGGTGAGGVALDSADRDNYLATASLRAGYELTPSVKPYVEGALLERVYDQEIDSGGYRRGSTGYELKTGVEIDLGAKLTADGSIGWHSEELRDRRFDPLEGLILDGSLVWSPSRLTTVTLSGSTAFEPTTLSNSSGSVQYSGSVKVAHSLRRNLEVDAGLGLAWRTYEGLGQEDLTTTGTVGLAWKFNRNAALTARYNYEALTSDRVGANYDANSVEIGLRLQR
ncbi:MAG: hypothetical protein C0606_17885 [Hyphomicrobiales bacterium]|nr:MAG: hypothetical protein C0606_17885 [Hyphomicrobiales bacterium]